MRVFPSTLERMSPMKKLHKRLRALAGLACRGIGTGARVGKSASGRTLALLMLAVAGSPLAHAAEGDQLYFTAFRAPIGSMSGAGLEERAVYLRWDVTEGNLPADLVGFKVLRDGAEIAAMPATGAMAADGILELYQPGDPVLAAANARRQAEVTAWLDELDDDVRNQSVNAGNFHQALASTLATNPLWSLSAARIDFNVARALYRGYLDQPLASRVEYVLIGVAANGTERRLGQVSVDTTGADVIPAAGDFAQVTNLGRCDAPDLGREHHVVALNWKLPGSNPTERYVFGLVNAGFDLYRTTGPVSGSPAPEDIANLAAKALFDDAGVPQIAGLEKVNDQPISAAGEADREARYRGYNPGFAQYLEFPADLAAAGLMPGDRRAYYLVPRDISGNYGESVVTLVTVTDRLPPPAPWAVRSFANRAAGSVTLQWDPVDLAGYYETHQDGRTYCNLDNARLDNQLVYVNAGETCDTGSRITVDFDVREYRVYAFADPGVAARFTDADGDGFADVDERRLDADPEGAVCDPALPGGAGGLQNYLADVRRVDAVDVSRSGRAVFNLENTAVEPGRPLWYRIASVDVDGNVSPLSPPARAVLDDLDLPFIPNLAGRLSRSTCQYSLVPRDAQGDVLVEEANPNGVMQTVALACSSSTQANPVLTLKAQRTGTARQVPLTTADCISQFEQLCGKEIINPVVTVLDVSGNARASRELGTGTSCPLAQLELVEDCSEPVLDPVADDRVYGRPDEFIFDTAGLPMCADIFLADGDTDLRLKTVCPGDPPFALGDLNLPEGESMCLAMAPRGKNGINGTRVPVCFVAGTVRNPQAPVPVSLALDAASTSATANLLLPPHRVHSVILELENRTTGQTETVSAPVPGYQPDAGEPVPITLELGAPPTGAGWREQWCIRARTVALWAPGEIASGLSAWSPTLCAERADAGVPPRTYLGWPGTPDIPADASLDWIHVTASGVNVIPLVAGFELPSDATCPGFTAPDCDQSKDISLVAGDKTFFDTCTYRPVRLGCAGQCARINAALSGQLGFVAYRQMRVNGVPGNFIQVSPLIETAFCRDSIEAPIFNDPFVRLIDVNAGPVDDGTGPEFVFVDGYPTSIPASTTNPDTIEYRYQLIYFDNRGEVTRTRTTPWKTPDTTP